MASTEVKFIQTTSSKLGSIPVRAGSIYFVTDTQKIYMDNIDGVRSEYSNTACSYGTCSTAADVVDKVITVPSGNFTLEAGATICVKFTNTNTAQNPTFNVNSTGAKRVWYNTALLTTASLGFAGTANRPMLFMYDGTQYVFIGWSMDTNTTYSNMSQTEATTGTATTARSISAKVLNDTITAKVPVASTTAPKMDGTASVGSETKWAKGDHVHPTDTTRAPLASPAFTGTPTVPTATPGTSTNQIATTEFVQTAAANATSASSAKLATARSIDGVNFDGTSDIVHYGTCDTAASTVNKVVSCPGFKLQTGSLIWVKFTVTNTGAVGSLKLNVNSTGAKAIKYRGANLPAASTLTSGRVYGFVYDGTNYEFIGDIDTNTTYPVASSSANGLMSSADKAKLDTIAEGATKVVPTTVTPKANGTAAIGSDTGYARGDHVHPSDSTKVPTSRTVNGKALSSNITLSASDVSAIPASQKGANSGVAELDATGKVPASQLPSFVDDVLEYTSKSSFPTTGETGKIYVDTTTNLTWRWSGSAYVEISPSLALGTTSSTAYRGDRGQAAYTHGVTNKGSAFSSGFYKITTNSEGHVTAATAVTKDDITALGVPSSDTTYTAGTGLSLSSNKFALSTPVSIANGGTGGTTRTAAANSLQVQSLGHGTAIADNTNIDTLMTLGNYYCNTSASAKTLQGTLPLLAADMAAFTMKVGYSTGTGYTYQELRIFSTGVTYYRYNNTTTDSTKWTVWKVFAPTSNYLRLSGGTVTGATTIQAPLTLYRESDTQTDSPAQIVFSVKDTTTGKTYSGANISAYQDHKASTAGVNMVIRPAGALFLGGGEGASAHYSLIKDTINGGENTYLTSDSDILVQAGANTIANRKGFMVNGSGNILPAVADVATNGVQSIGLSDYKWNAMYANTFYGALSGNASTATEFSATTTVAATGDATGTSAASKKGWSIPLTLTNSGVTAGEYGPTANATPAFGATFNVPDITVDAKGRVTSAANRTVKIPAAPTTITGNAGTATKLKAATTIDGVTFDGSAAIAHYGTSSTAAATVAKVAACTGFTLVTGSRVAVKFTYANTAASPTLNVNSTGAKSIMQYGTTAAASGAWKAGEVVEFIYDGTNYEIVDGGVRADSKAYTGTSPITISGSAIKHANSGATAGTYGTNSTTALTPAFGETFSVPGFAINATGHVTSATSHTVKMPAAPTTVSGNAGSATKLATGRTIDGVSFNGTAAITHFANCSTAGDVAEKVVSCPGFTLVNGARITVRFSYTNRVAAPTLNVNSTGAKPILYGGKSVVCGGMLGYPHMHTFIYYNGSYHLANTDATILEITEELSPTDLGVPISENNTEDFLKAWIKYIFDNYRAHIQGANDRHSLRYIVGRIYPNSLGIVTGFIYPNSVVESSGLPTHCTFQYIPYLSSYTRGFGTSYGEWFYKDTSSVATTSTSGLMSAADKTKLNQLTIYNMSNQLDLNKGRSDSLGLSLRYDKTAHDLILEVFKNNTRIAAMDFKSKTWGMS